MNEYEDQDYTAYDQDRDLFMAAMMGINAMTEMENMVIQLGAEALNFYGNSGLRARMAVRYSDLSQLVTDIAESHGVSTLEEWAESMDINMEERFPIVQQTISALAAQGL